MRKKLSSKFQGKKLKQARLIRNLTIQELSEMLGITHQAVSKYEKDQMEPSYEILKKMSNTLNFKSSFFFNEPLDEQFYENPFIFRKKSGVAKKYQNQLIEHMSMVSQFVSYINEFVNLPKFDNALIKKTNSKFQATEDEDMEVLATSIRRYLKLGDGPIDNMTLLCEKLGVIVVFADLSKSLIDGCSTVYRGRPIILLNNKKESSVRTRFTLAHELGHILIHSNLPSSELLNSSNSKRIEYEANLFASFLLMPESTFSQDINGLGLDYLLVMKEHWKVSLQAMIFRAEYLEYFSQDYALYLRQQISRKKWRTKEPLDDKIRFEDPILLRQAIEFLIKSEKKSLSEISFQTGVTEDEILYIFANQMNNKQQGKTMTRNGLELRRIK